MGRVRASVLMCISIYMLGVSVRVCTHDEGARHCLYVYINIYFIFIVSVCTHGKGARQCSDIYMNLYIESECECVYT